MKRTIAVYLSVFLATLSLLTVPVGLADAIFDPIGGTIITVLGGLMMGLGIILNRWIDRPKKTRRE